MAFLGAVPSRYSVLKIEGEDDIDERISKERAKKSEIVKPKPVKKKPKNNKKNAEIAELQSIAFGKTKSKIVTSSKTKKNPANHVPKEQWEEWIKKDSEHVAESYEQDLQQALMLSKIEFEEKKNDIIPKNDQNKGQKKKGKEKEKTISLEEFNKSIAPKNDVQENLGKKRIGDPLNRLAEKSKTVKVDDTTFFDKLVEDVDRIVLKEMRQEEYRKIEPLIADTSRILQYQDQLEKKEEEISILKLEVLALKSELQEVRKRNKQLCSIIAQGEMKGKVDILMQVEELTAVKDELTEQVTQLHALLEQERSKVHSMKTDLNKYQSGKHK